MAYYEIRDWSKGIDLRRLAEATKAGALQSAVNCHVTRGGELEKRKAIPEIYTLPSDCHGLWVDPKGQHHVWSINADPGGLDARVVWHQIVNPDDALEDINRILSYDDYYSIPYVVVEFQDGSIHHYYDDVRIREDGGLPPDASDVVPPAFGNGRAYSPYFELSIDSIVSPVASLTEAWLIAPDDVATPGNWYQLNGIAVPYATSAQEWARQIAAEINNTTTVPNVYCEAEDGKVRLSMADIDDQYNGWMIQLDITGNAQALPTKVQTLSYGEDNTPPAIPDPIPVGDYDYTMDVIYYLKGGSTPMFGFKNPSLYSRPIALETVNINGSLYVIQGTTPLQESVEHPGYYEYNVLQAITDVTLIADTQYVGYASINDFSSFNQAPDADAPEPEEDTSTPPAPTAPFSWKPGTYVSVHGSKVYAVSGPALNFSAIGNARVWNPDFAGAGFIDSSIQSSGPKELVSIGEYGVSQLALFARRDVQIWDIDPDPGLNRIRQVLRNTGTFASRSVTTWGNDLMYLDKPGIRTLRARDSSNAAWVQDVGVPIDQLVKSISNAAGSAMSARAIGAVDPDDGRFMLAINRTIFVLSFYPQSRISAWTTYRPGFRVDEMVAGSDQVFFRSGTGVYALGGETGQEYDACLVEAEIPYLDFDDPGSKKEMHALDMAAQGVWTIQAGMDPMRPEVRDAVATIDGTTFRLFTIGMEGYTSHIKLKFTNSAQGPAKLGTVLVHYTKGEAL